MQHTRYSVFVEHSPRHWTQVQIKFTRRKQVLREAEALAVNLWPKRVRVEREMRRRDLIKTFNQGTT